MNSNTFGKKSSAMSFAYESSSNQNQEKPDYGKEDSNKTYSLFDWVLDRLPNEDTFWGTIITIPLGIIFTIGLVPYGVVLEVLQNIVKKFGWEPYPDSSIRKGRFAFLTITTLAAFIYLPVFFYFIFTSSQNKYPATIRIAIGITLTSMVILFVLSEWIGYFLMEIWRTSLNNDIVPIKRQE